MSRRWFCGVIAVCVVRLLLPAVVAAQTAGDEELKLLYSFRTEPYGFTPDDVVYSPRGGDLLFSAGANPSECFDNPLGRGVYRFTVTGRLVEHIPLPAEVLDTYMGFGITTATSGREVGNVYLTNSRGTSELGVWVLGRDFDVLGDFNFTICWNGSYWGGNAIAYDQIHRTLWIADENCSDIYKIGLDGTRMAGPFHTSVGLTGLTYNVMTQTLFGVCAGGHNLLEIDLSGVELRSFDLAGFGIEQPVGVAAGLDMLFIADEGDCNNKGVVWVFRSPGKASRVK